MSKWRPTPKHRLFSAKRFDLSTGEWLGCAYADLKVGDIFKAFAPDGEQIDPLTEEPDEVVAYCHADAIRGYGRNEGFAVEISTGETLEDILQMIGH